MEIKTELNYLRIAPRKTRLVADLIKGKRVKEAQRLLSFCLKRGAGPIKKLLNSAIANGKNNFNIENLDNFIVFIKVDEGPKIKRWRARARGRAMEIQKKTSHITLILKQTQQETKEK